MQLLGTIHGRAFGFLPEAAKAFSKIFGPLRSKAINGHGFLILLRVLAGVKITFPFGTLRDRPFGFMAVTTEAISSKTFGSIPFIP